MPGLLIDGTVTLTRADAPGGIIKGTFTGDEGFNDPEYCPVVAYAITFRAKREANTTN